jgi:hypothetical protein
MFWRGISVALAYIEADFDMAGAGRLDMRYLTVMKRDGEVDVW